MEACLGCEFFVLSVEISMNNWNYWIDLIFFFSSAWNALESRIQISRFESFPWVIIHVKIHSLPIILDRSCMLPARVAFWSSFGSETISSFMAFLSEPTVDRGYFYSVLILQPDIIIFPRDSTPGSSLIWTFLTPSFLTCWRTGTTLFLVTYVASHLFKPDLLQLFER